MKWLLLLASIVFEVGGTTMLKLAGRSSEHAWKWGLGVAISYGLCFLALGYAMRLFPLGVLYGMWAGGGIALVAIIGILFFGDELNLLRVASFLLVIAGVIGLNLGRVAH